MGNVKPVKMGKAKVWVAKDAFDLCEILGLSAEDAVEMEFKHQLKNQIKTAVKAKKLTHEQAAKMSGTSRTRMTAILNNNTTGVSSDLLMRILYSLGYQTKVTFTRARRRRNTGKTAQLAG